MNYLVQPPQPDGQLAKCPRIYIPENVWEDMLSLVIVCPIEINGFGYVDPTPDGIWVTEVFTLPQVASAVHVTTDYAALDRHQADMMRNGQDTSRLRFQWHSHVNMPAQFSGVDLENIGRWPGSWLISLVANVRGEFSCRFDMRQEHVWLGADVMPTIVKAISPQKLQDAADTVKHNVRRSRRGFWPIGAKPPGDTVYTGLPASAVLAYAPDGAARVRERQLAEED